MNANGEFRTNQTDGVGGMDPDWAPSGGGNDVVFHDPGDTITPNCEDSSTRP